MSAFTASGSISVHESTSRPGTTAARFVRVMDQLIPATAIAAAAIGLALHTGLQVGISNHCQYLLHGLHAADPSFLANDWFTTQTPDHHAPFTLLVEWLSRFGILNIGLGLLNAAATVVYAIALYFIVARFSVRPLAPYAAALILTAFMPIAGPGHSHILLPYFVPSVFSGVAMLVAISLLLYNRTRLAGLASAISCAVHANYLILIAPVWLFVIVLSPKSERKRLTIDLFAPWLLAWLPHLSIIVRVLADPSDALTIRRIFWEYYAPLHYDSSTWAIAPLAKHALVLLAGGVAAYAVRSQLTRMATSIVLAIATVVVFGAFGTMVLDNDFVTNLFTWRLAPFLTIAATVSMALLFDASCRARMFLWLYTLLSVMGLLWLTNFDVRGLTLLSVVIAGLIAIRLANLAFERFIISQQPIRFFLIGVLAARSQTLICSLGLLALAALGTRSGLWRQDMFTRQLKPDVAALFTWCRNSTPPGTQFTVPPDLIAFRLETGRPILVDYKSIAYMPAMQLEWYRRHMAQCGAAPTSYDDAVAKYATLDGERAIALQHEFSTEFIVTDKRLHEGDLTAFVCAFENNRFRVYKLPVSTTRTRTNSPVTRIDSAKVAQSASKSPLLTDHAEPRR